MIRILTSGFQSGFSNDLSNILRTYIGQGLNFAFVASEFDRIFEKTDWYCNHFLEMFSKIDINFRSVQVVDSRMSKEAAQETLKRADIIWLSGGDTPTQFSYLKSYDLIQCLKAHSGIIIGMSAGAINMAKTAVCTLTCEHNQLEIYEGLGLVEFSVEPHFDKNNVTEELLVLSETYPLIGICDEGAIICTDDKTVYIGDIFLLNDRHVTPMIKLPSHIEYKSILYIDKGFSSDKKYCVTTATNEKLLIRISNMEAYHHKKKEFDLVKDLFDKNLPVPKPIEFGLNHGDGYVYTILNWIDGCEIESCLSDFSEEKQFQLGKQAGQILKNIHKTNFSEADGNWYHNYYQVIKPRLEAYQTEGLDFDGSRVLLKYLDDNKFLLQERPQSIHHGDYHIGNMVMSQNQELSIIDWHTVDFDNYGDPWYEFNRIDTNYTAFASGQIYGYFDGVVPTEFWKLFAYYISASAITSIVWAKYNSMESMDEILDRNKAILSWFDNMQSIKPRWYKTNY